MAELVIERAFNAPRELVWKAFTDPDQLAQWFGPVGYSVPRESVEVDARTGGVWRLTMVADSPEYPPGGPVDAVLDEVVENEYFVGHQELEGEMAEMFGTDRIELRVELYDDESGGTRLVLKQGPYNEEMAGSADEGWNSSFTKLDKLLAG